MSVTMPGPSAGSIPGGRMRTTEPGRGANGSAAILTPCHSCGGRPKTGADHGMVIGCVIAVLLVVRRWHSKTHFSRRVALRDDVLHSGLYLRLPFRVRKDVELLSPDGVENPVGDRGRVSPRRGNKLSERLLHHGRLGGR